MCVCVCLIHEVNPTETLVIISQVFGIKSMVSCPFEFGREIGPSFFYLIKFNSPLSILSYGGLASALNFFFFPLSFYLTCI